MNPKKLSSRLYSMGKSILAAAILPVFLIYIMIDKPDYKVMNGLSHVVLPLATWAGDAVTWPVRAVGKAASGIREFSNLRSENEELRARLSEALRQQNECDVAREENQLLRRDMDIVQATPQKAVVARISFDNAAFHHSTFFIDKGAASGIEPGMAAVSTTGALVGIIIDVGADFARVRALNDAKSNIPVRIAGSEVYGFLQGNGSDAPAIGFLSDPEFQSVAGLRLVTSSIRGILPDGIMVGETRNAKDVKVLAPVRASDVMVLKFDAKDRYK